MKKIFIFCILILTSTPLIAREYSQIPLLDHEDKFVQRHKDWKEKNNIANLSENLVNFMLYECLRCSAFYLWRTTRAVKESSQKKKVFSEKYYEFTIIASMFYSLVNGTDFNNSNSLTLEIIDKMFKNYSDDSKTIYIKTGSYIAEYIKEDESYCENKSSEEELKKFKAIIQKFKNR